jgi:hypothetical protein
MTDILDIQCPRCGVMVTIDGDCVELNCPKCGEYINVGDHLEPLMNDDDIYADDIYIDERIDSKPNATYHFKMLLVSQDLDTVTIDRALLVRLARIVSEMRLVELMDYGTIDDARALRERCEQILREHDHI